MIEQQLPIGILKVFEEQRKVVHIVHEDRDHMNLCCVVYPCRIDNYMEKGRILTGWTLTTYFSNDILCHVADRDSVLIDTYKNMMFDVTTGKRII